MPTPARRCAGCGAKKPLAAFPRRADLRKRTEERCHSCIQSRAKRHDPDSLLALPDERRCGDCRSWHPGERRGEHGECLSDLAARKLAAGGVAGLATFRLRPTADFGCRFWRGAGR